MIKASNLLRYLLIGRDKIMGITDNVELLDIDFKGSIGCLLPVGLKPKNHLGKYDLVYNAKIIYVSDLHLDFYVKNKRKAEKQIYDIIDKMIENTPLLLYLNYPEKAKEKQIGWESLCLSEGESVETLLYSKYIYIVFGGDIAENYEYSKIFYHRIREIFPKYRMVAILGNHELASFKTVREALETYGEFLLSENIVLLNNAGVTALDTFMLRQDDLDHIHGMNIFDWPDRGLLPVNELCFYGGIGFNKYDDAHTSETIRTCPELQGRPDLEAERCESFIEGYKKGTAGIVSLAWQGIMCNPKIFSSRYREELMSLSGDTGGRQIIASHKDDILLVEAESEEEVMDIDRL